MVLSRQGRRDLQLFFDELRDAAVRERRHVHISFDDTIQMTAPGTILFAAELDRIRALQPNAHISCNWPRNAVVAQVLQHVGVFQKLGMKRTCKITANNVRWWKVATGSQVSGEQVGQAMAEYEHLFSSSKTKTKLYRGLTEAMANSRHHAYAEERGDGYKNVLKNWWMFSEHRDGHLVVAFCDIGIGIPRSLPLNDAGLWDDIRELFMSRTDNDAERIRAAIEVGRSRTGKGHRGKGLMEIRSVLDALRGRLAIHSNRGSYLYDASNKQEKAVTFSANIRGTVIMWNIPVVQEQHHGD